MKTIRIITPSNVEIEYRLAGAGSRLAAFVVDLFVQAVVCLALAVSVAYGVFGSGLQSLANVGGYALGFLIVACFAILVGYFIFCEMKMNGQSIGKKIFGLRVIRENGQPVGFAQSLIRGVFRFALDMLYVGLIMIMLTKNHKRFGDYAAGTVVVSERRENLVTNKNIFPEADAVLARRYPNINLTRDEKFLLEEYFEIKKTFPDGGEALRLRIIDYFLGKWKIDPKLLDDDALRLILRSVA